MGLPLTIQPEDAKRLDSLKASLGAKTKVEVLRRALDMLEDDFHLQVRAARRRRSARIVSKESASVNREFQKHSLLHKS